METRSGLQQPMDPGRVSSSLVCSISELPRPCDQNPRVTSGGCSPSLDSEPVGRLAIISPFVSLTPLVTPRRKRKCGNVGLTNLPLILALPTLINYVNAVKIKVQKDQKKCQARPQGPLPRPASIGRVFGLSLVGVGGTQNALSILPPDPAASKRIAAAE